MILRRKGIWYKIYEFTYEAAPTEDGCDFLKYLPLAVLALPLTVAGWWSAPNDLASRMAAGFTTYVLGFFLAAFVAFAWFNPGKAVIGLSVTAAILGTVGLLIWAVENHPWQYLRRWEIVLIIRERKRALKEKYCPHIDWV